MLIKLKKKAQSTAEYVTLFAIVVGGITMATSLVKKSVAAKVQTGMKNYMESGEGLQATLFTGNTDDPHFSTSRANSYSGQKGGLTKANAQETYVAESQGSESKRVAISGNIQEAVDAANGVNLVDIYANKGIQGTTDKTGKAFENSNGEMVPNAPTSPADQGDNG